MVIFCPVLGRPRCLIQSGHGSKLRGTGFVIAVVHIQNFKMSKAMEHVYIMLSVVLCCTLRTIEVIRKE